MTPAVRTAGINPAAGQLLLFLCIFGLVWLASLAANAAQTAPPITAAAFVPNDAYVVFGSQAGIEVRSWPDCKVTSRIKTKLSHVHDLAFSPNGKMLLAAGGSPAASGAAELLSWPGGAEVRRIADYKDLVYRAAWSPDGQRFATAAADGTCRVYDAETGKPLIRYEGHSRPVLAIVFLPDGKTVISAGVDQSLQVWDATTGKPARTLDNHTNVVNDLAVRPNTPDGAPAVLASVGEDRTVRLWQPTIGRLMRFARLDSAPRAVAWSPSGEKLVVGCSDGKVRVLDFDTLTVVMTKPALAGRIHALTVKASAAVVAGDGGAVTIEW